LEEKVCREPLCSKKRVCGRILVGGGTSEKTSTKEGRRGQEGKRKKIEGKDQAKAAHKNAQKQDLSQTEEKGG